jgi:hypothetical protein
MHGVIVTAYSLIVRRQSGGLILVGRAVSFIAAGRETGQRALHMQTQHALLVVHWVRARRTKMMIASV